MSESSELDILTNQYPPITVADREIAVRPIKVGQFAAFIRAAGPLFSDAATDPAELVMHYPEEIIAALSAASDLEEAWLRDRDLAEMTELLEAFIGVNQAFFVARLRPALERLVSRIARLVGPTSSSASAATGTAAPTS